MKRISGAVFFLLLFSAAAVRAQTQKNFYDRVFYYSDSLYLKGQVWLAAKMELEQTKEKEYEDLESPRKDIEDFITGEIAWVNSLKNTTDYEPLKTAVLEFLNFELDMLRNCMIPFEKLNDRSTPEEVKLAYQNFFNTYQKEGAALLKFAGAQEQFAEKFDIPQRQ